MDFPSLLPQRTKETTGTAKKEKDTANIQWALNNITPWQWSATLNKQKTIISVTNLIYLFASSIIFQEIKRVDGVWGLS